MTCILEGCDCEGRARADWPMETSPAAFWPHKLRPRPYFRRHHAPDRFVEDMLKMATARVPVE